MSEFDDPGTSQDIAPTSDVEPDEPISRRRLVVGGLAAVGMAAVAAGTLGRAATAVAAQDPLSSKVIVADPSLCVGCLACEVSCSEWHDSVGRSALPRIHILATPDVALDPKVATILPARAGFTPQTCRQCPTPYCLPNCPTTGLRIDPETGNRYIAEEDCIACGKCEVDCPVEWEGTLALKARTISSKRIVYDAEKNVYTKCDLCIGREGGPICVERCPVNVAIRAGYIHSANLALDVKPSTEEQWKRLA
jgi:Fe-S-cluster-containing dehydrogenase component